MDHPTTERLIHQSIVPSYHIQDSRILRAYCTNIYVYKLWAAASLGKSLKYHWKMDSLRYITREVMRAHRNRRQKCICTMGSEVFWNSWPSFISQDFYFYILFQSWISFEGMLWNRKFVNKNFKKSFLRCAFDSWGRC